MKWYIVLPQHSFWDFNTLEMDFLTHFKLPIQYEICTYLLTSLLHTTSTHIHEWRQWCRLIKAPIPDQLLIDLLTKSLLFPIYRDSSMWGAVTEEDPINHSQYLNFFYSQSGNFYDLVSHGPLPTSHPSRPAMKPPSDGILGAVQT